MKKSVLIISIVGLFTGSLFASENHMMMDKEKCFKMYKKMHGSEMKSKMHEGEINSKMGVKDPLAPLTNFFDSSEG